MIKIRMVHKGLILVAIPLLFGAGFISLLFVGLLNLERLVQREHLLKDAISCHMTALRCAAAAKRIANEYKFKDDTNSNKRPINIEQVRNAIWKMRLRQFISDHRNEAADFDNRVKLLLSNEPELLRSALKSSSLQLLSTSSSGYVAESTFLNELRHASDIQTSAATRAMSSLRDTLYGGMAIGAVICVILTFYFCLNIRNRLLIILHNTVSLSKGSKLSPPLQGNDEISELDQFLFKSANEIKELERFKHEMIGVVSHELKSPLSSVAMFLNMLSAGTYGNISDRAKSKIERTSANAKRLMGLIADLLNLDRLELEMTPSEISVDELLKASVDSVKELSEKSSISIKVLSHGGKIYADRDRLIQVIVNLLSNAMKFSPPQGQVSLDTCIKEEWFECRVIDQGRGIPEAFRKQIFEPFQQVDTKDATTKKGTGLGLTISKSIVEKHRGIIGVDSEEGKGSSFWFKIPATASESDRRSLQDTSKAPGQLNTSPKSTQLILNGSTNGGGQFNVLHQGLVIIALPLVFQISFGCLMLHSLDQVGQQLAREENSMEILNTLNRGAELYYAAMYSFSSKDPNFRSRCLDDQEKVFAVLDKVEKLCAGDRQELTDNRESRRCLRIAYDSMKNMTLQPVQTSTMKQPSALDPGQDITTDPETVKEIYPIFEAQNAEEKLMLREREIGANLGSQRVQMLKNLEDTLIGGIIVNCILSSLLAVTVMRNLSKRLKHVLENTGRLVRREVLDLPIKGGDEIAYLDKVLFQTGNHLLELEKFKQELISIVSHELRTPLMSISTSLQLFESDLVIGDLSEKGKDRLRIASEEANRLIRLINDLLDIEKMEAGKFVLDCSEVKAIELVQMSIASVAQPAEAKQLALLPVLEDIELKLHGDKDRICQVLINFLSNAIKFSQEKQTIQISVKKIGTNELKFCVIDQGRGIPEETRQRIFGRFVQVEREDSTVRGGTGLGLAISKAIVEQHGGTIGVDSELGAGSTFWFKLPQAGPA